LALINARVLIDPAKVRIMASPPPETTVILTVVGVDICPYRRLETLFLTQSNRSMLNAVPFKISTVEGIFWRVQVKGNGVR
jgi:hypothetical protein